jgi:phospholipid/cholesterol/gamma-HCH transport system substrate-binding protein
MSPRNKSMGWRELRLGLFVVAAIAGLIILLLNASSNFSWFSRKVKLRARFPSADGVRQGSDVQLAGMHIGQVDDVRILDPTEIADSPYKVEVRFSVDQKIDGRDARERIRTDSKAQLTNPSLLGSDRIVNITPGTPLGQPISDNALLQTMPPSGIDQLLSSGGDLAQQLNELSKQFTDIATRINQGQGTLGRFVNDESFYNNLNATMRQTQDLMRQIQSGQGSAGKFINDPALYNNLNALSTQLQTIADNLQKGRGTAGKLLTDEQLYNDVRATVTKANRSIDEIQGLVSDVRAGRGTLGKLATDEAIYNDARIAIARFNTTAERLDSLIAGIQRGEGTAGKLVTDEQLYNNVNQLSSESVKLLYDFRQNPKKYLSIKLSIF